MADANLLCDAPVTLIAGPEEYLFGEEKALLEVIEGNDPMPRWLPPYVHGLFATTPQEGWSAGSGAIDADDAASVGSNPTLVTNVETLANVPLIVTRGAEWYRTIGTRETPGPLICTVVGDVMHAGFAEVEPGTTLREVIDRVGGGVACRSPGEGGVVGRVESRAPGRAARRARQLRRAWLRRAAGWDRPGSSSTTTRAAWSPSRMVSRFLYVESCGQCRVQVRMRRDHAHSSTGSPKRTATCRDIESIGERLLGITDQNRCFLGEEEQRVIASLLRAFPEDFTAELEGAPPLGAARPEDRRHPRRRRDLRREADAQTARLDVHAVCVRFARGLGTPP